MKEEKPEKVGGFLTDVRRRIRNNKNAIIVLVGETGSGKSYSALRIAEQLDKEFNIDRCVFSGLSFMELVKKGKLKRGSVIMFDECGIDLDARNFWSVSNKMISYTLESFRYMNLVLILTVPSLSFVDSKLRKLVHYLVETRKIDFEKEVVIAKVLRLDHSPRSESSKVYQKFIIYAGTKLKKTQIAKPSDEIIKAYEKKKKKILDKMYKDIYSELKYVKQKERMKKLGLNDIIERVTNNPKKYLKKWGNRTILDEHLLASDFNIGLARAKSIKKKVEQNLAKKK